MGTGQLTLEDLRSRLQLVRAGGPADSVAALNSLTDVQTVCGKSDVAAVNDALVELVKLSVTSVEAVTGAQAALLFILGDVFKQRMPTVDHSRVRAALIRQLLAVVQQSPAEAVGELCGRSSAVCAALLRLLAAEGRSADEVNAGACFDLFAAVAHHPNGTVGLFQQTTFVENLRALLTSSKIEPRLRLHEACVRIMCASPEDGVDAAINAGVLEALVAELKTCSDDVLAVLNVLELLADAAAQQVRVASALHQLGVTAQLSTMLQQTMDGVDGGFIFPGLIRFFGYVAAVRPADVLAAYPTFARAVFTLCARFDHVDVCQRLLGFDTVGVIGRTAAGKDALAGFDNEMRVTMACWARAARSGPVEVRSRHLLALADLFHLPISEQTGERLALLQKWFEWMCVDNVNFIDTVVKYWREPITSTRNAAAAVLLNLCPQPWAQRKMAACSGFFEALTDRGGSWEADGRRAKYDMACKLADSPTAGEHFDPAQTSKLRVYKQQGPFFAPAQHDVAFEGD